jgi:hypothetical protein
MVYRSISDTAYSIAQTPLFGLMIKAEPRWGRVDDVSGEPVDRYGVDLALVADKELVPNRIVAALNLIYLPEVARSRVTGIWLRQATIGVATALMRRLALIFSLGPKLDIFAATTDWVSTASRATAFPTIYAKLSKRSWILFAWNVQVAGRSADGPVPLDLRNFERHQATLRFGFTF